MIDVKYRSRAVERMLQRNISTVEVESVIFEPDGVIKQSQDKFIYYKKLKGRTDNMIAVVAISKKQKSFEILTVMIEFKVV